MKRTPIIALLALGIAVPLCAQPYQDDDLALLDSTLARVKPGMRAKFETGNWRYGCESAVEARCRSKTYVVGGDVVLVGKTRGEMVRAAYTNGIRMTHDWLPKAALITIPTPVATLAAWRGRWARDDEATIEIRAGKRPGALSFAGDALWGTHDPDRVKRGGIHMGEFAGEATPVRGRIVHSDGDGMCHVTMRVIGPFLAVADNGKCGGQNVSFSGVYRKQ